jgi:hypothetical protein
MRNPFRSEPEAFRFLVVVIVGALVIVGAAYINTWVGVAAAVLVVGGIVWWLMQEPVPGLAEPALPLASSTPPGTHRVLVLAEPGTSPGGAAGKLDGQTAEVVVVVPAEASTVEALTGAVDDRRAEAEQTAAAWASALVNAGLRARGEVGADDPVLAIEDALRTFGADEIVVVGGDAELLAKARERFAMPVSKL